MRNIQTKDDIYDPPPPPCLIKQSACGRSAAEPICPKCGLDERIGYIGEEAALLAKSQAQARYWQSHAEGLQAQLSKTPEPPQTPDARPSKKYQIIEQRVKKIVAEQLGLAEVDIKIESSFVDDLGADSLDSVELVMALEDEFEMEIPEEHAEQITTVKQVIDYATAHVKA